MSIQIKVRSADDAQFVAWSLYLVLAAAAWVLEEDNPERFKKFMEEVGPDSIPSDVDHILDEAIANIDIVRMTIARQYGIDVGEPYPRKFPS